MKGQPIDIELIAAPLGWGAQLHEAEWGIQALNDYGLFNALEPLGKMTTWAHQVNPATAYSAGKKLSYAQRVEEVAFFAQHLSEVVKTSLLDQHCPLVIGGDHAIAIGTWSGVVNALNAEQEFGLIWIDAHMDSHTPQTTPSQAIHGMPLAALMGYGEPTLINVGSVGAKLNPRHVVLIGVRSFEEGEAALLAKLNVKIYFMTEVKQRGFSAIFNDALNIVTNGTKGFGVSIDLDAFDPIQVPGVGTPAPDGIQPNEIYPSLTKLRKISQFKALEIAEHNPTQDSDHKTAKVIQKLIESLVSHD
ncbi:MAG: arginase [Candidatus Berkiellales bacterium]